MTIEEEESLYQELDKLAQRIHATEGHRLSGPGHGPTAMTEARRRICYDRELDIHTVRNIQLRVRERHLADPPIEGTPKHKLELQVEADPAWLDKARRVGLTLDRAEWFGRQIQLLLTNAVKVGLPFNDSRLDVARRSARELSSLFRSLQPQSTCPYCKLIPEVLESCAACARTGYIVVSQAQGVPEELWDELDPVVLRLGRFVTVKAFEGR